MTLNEIVETLAHEHAAERQRVLAELADLDAALDAIAQQYGSNEIIADAQLEARTLRVRLRALSDGSATVH
jgi:hypothetical protein